MSGIWCSIFIAPSLFLALVESTTVVLFKVKPYKAENIVASIVDIFK